MDLFGITIQRTRRFLMRQCLIAIAALALTLSGCSSGPLFDVPVPVRQADPYETVQQFYRPLAANAVRALR